MWSELQKEVAFEDLRHAAKIHKIEHKYGVEEAMKQDTYITAMKLIELLAITDFPIPAIDVLLSGKIFFEWKKIWNNCEPPFTTRERVFIVVVDGFDLMCPTKSHGEKIAFQDGILPKEITENLSEMYKE